LENIGAKMDFENIDEFIETVEQPTVTDTLQKEYDKDLYKKWFRSKTQSGFLSIKPWYQGLKFKVDIGKTSADGKLLSSTMVYLDAIDFSAYLNSVANGTGKLNYTQSDKSGVPTNEGFVSYGGGIIESKPISRIFKSHYWQNSDQSYDDSAFVWKCGHFAARKTESGAFIPDMKTSLSVDSIKVTRAELCSISNIINLSLISHVTNKSDWYAV
jgi:hypothetical protein